MLKFLPIILFFSMMPGGSTYYSLTSTHYSFPATDYSRIFKLDKQSVRVISNELNDTSRVFETIKVPSLDYIESLIHTV